MIPMKSILTLLLISGTVTAVTIPGLIQPALTQAKPANASTKSRSYVGLVYRDLPQGLSSQSGWVVRYDDANNATYTASVIQKGQTRMLWFLRVVKYNENGQPTFQVVDVLKLPAMDKSQQLMGRFCRLNEENDREISAIVRVTDTEYYTEVTKAWRTNPLTEKIEPINTKGIDCGNQGWGT
jgi:hypothetical protein